MRCGHCAWHKFCQHTKYIAEPKHVFCIAVEVISNSFFPNAMSGLALWPLTHNFLPCLDVVQ